LGEQFFQIRAIFEIQLSWEVKTVRMVDQLDRFYREVLESYPGIILPNTMFSTPKKKLMNS
jgi:hypothetical protein